MSDIYDDRYIYIIFLKTFVKGTANRNVHIVIECPQMQIQGVHTNPASNVVDSQLKDWGIVD